MEKINHLDVSETNYKCCINALAARDFNKATGWINSAVKHIKLHIEEENPVDLSAVYAKKREYESLAKAIRAGGEKAGEELPFPTIESVGVPPAEAKFVNRAKKSGITFDDVVGLESIKEAVRAAVVYPFTYKRIYTAFKRKSGGGILLYGAPGTGKTMIARAIAGEVDAEFISVNCSDIYSKWMGESQQNIKSLFNRARRAKCAVIFFDEFEALGCRRSDRGEERDPGNDVVCELLAQMDGFCSSESTVLAVAATNRPWDIDPALLRPGRFEKRFYIAMPNALSRAEIVKKQMDGLPAGDISYGELAEGMAGFSAADVTELCNRAKDRAIMRSIKSNRISKITNGDFTDALAGMRSSVDAECIRRLESFA